MVLTVDIIDLQNLYFTFEILLAATPPLRNNPKSANCRHRDPVGGRNLKGPVKCWC